MDFGEKKVAILGLGIEGKDAVRFLSSRGAHVVIFDKKSREELNLDEVRSLKFDVRCGEDYLGNGLVGFDYIVRSPGIRPDLPEILDAIRHGTKLTSAINIFLEFCPCPIVGVTGTKGKGTTATLIHECLSSSGLTSYLAGNIGTPYLELLEKLTKSDIVILELSSFQLIDIQKSPHIAVVLNITADHLDWHKDENEYFSAKENTVKHQTEKDFAILMRDYEIPKNFAEKTKAKVLWASIKEKVRGASVENGEIYLNVDNVDKIGKVENLLIRGRHNWENVCLAVAGAYVAGATIEGIKRAVFSFAGLPHRLEKVGEVKGVTFYNDSFATSPAPTLAAVNSFTEPIILILGGSSKNLDYREMAEALAKVKNLKSVVIVGEVGDEIKRTLEDRGFAGRIIDGGGTMRQIVKTAMSHATNGDVVLLSPAAASFDMFRDYKDRGEQFKEEVEKLSGKER